MVMVSVLYNSQEINAIELSAGTLTIGRSGDNNVRLDDQTISKYHAKIVTYFNATHVEDLGSTNGTYVNGKKVRQHVLQSGDILLIGKHQIRIDHDPAATMSTASSATRSA